MNSNLPVIVAFYVILLATVGEGFEEGGPISLCYDPYPHHHGHYRSTEPTPYKITISPGEYKPGDAIKVSISSSSEKIKGFQIGAHSIDGLWSHLYGEFSSYPSSATPYKYYSDSINCVTHGDDFEKTHTVEFTWIAPSVSVGDLIFSATVVKSFHDFWVNQTAVLKAKQPANTTAIEPSLQIRSGNFDSDLDLAQCTSASGCVTYPKNCMADACKLAVSFKIVSGGIRFRLMNKLAAASQSYIALGISADQSMKGDETFTCLDVGGSLDFAHGYNPAMYNIKVKSDKAKDIAIRSMDGVLSCEFTRELKGEFQWFKNNKLASMPIDYESSVETPEYHLYLSWGQPYPGSKESAEKHVQLPKISRSKVAFGKNGRHHFYSLHDNVKVHVTLMVVAWCGAAAISMIVSRYYKDGFLNAHDKLCGLKPWFQVHRGLAITTALLTSASFIIIFVHYMDLNTDQLLHACFGIAVMFLTCLQVLAGMLRPDPSSGKKRAIFNTVHRLSGILTYVLAAATMLIGTNIGYMSDAMRVTGTGLLSGLVAIQVLTAIILEVISCRRETKEDESVIQKSTDTLSVEEPATRTKQTVTATHTKSLAIFVLYSTLMIALIICFLAVLWMLE